MQDLISRSSLPFQEGTSTLERCSTTKVAEATKAATKASPSSPNKNTTKVNSALHSKVLIKVAQPLHKVEATPQHRGSQLHLRLGSYSSPQMSPTTGTPQQETPYKDPPNRRSRVTRFPNGNCFDPKSLRCRGRSAPPLQNTRRNRKDMGQGGRSTKF